MPSPWLPALLTGLLAGCAHTRAASPTPTRPPPAAAPLVEHGDSITQEQALVAFARLYGYVRFFHPTDASHAADWSRLTVAGVLEVGQAGSREQLARRLDDFFRPLAPSLQLWVDGEAAPRRPPAPRRSEVLVFWQYQGFPGSWLPMLHRAPYAQSRVFSGQTWQRRFSETPAPDAHIAVELAPRLQVRLPVVLSAEQATSTARPPSPALDPRLDHRALAVRQAAVIEVWNVLRHFYPYQHDLELDWDAMLVTALREAEDDESIADVCDTLRGLLTPLRDGHAEVAHLHPRETAKLPLRLEIVDGQAVVTGTHDPGRFAIGDVVTHIGERPARPWIEEIAGRLSGTPQWRQFRAAAWEAPRAGFGEVVELVVERDGDTRQVAAMGAHLAVPSPPRPPARHTFADGVRYVDLTRIDPGELAAELPLLARARGVVFDMRGYPSENHEILDHLLREPEDSLWMHVPRFVEPDGRIVGWQHLGWHRRPSAPHIGAPVVFLISAEAISYAESILSYVEAHALGTLVGTPTAGANGDIVRFDTVAGFYVIYTGMRVTRHDGSPFHDRGIQPHVEVWPTLAGLRAGRDEVLEAGLRTVRAGVVSTAARGTIN